MNASAEIRNIERTIENYFHRPLRKSMGQRTAQPFETSLAELSEIETEQARLLRSTTLARHNSRMDEAIRDGASTLEVAKMENARNRLGYSYQ